MADTWKSLAAEKKQRQKESIPQEWLISVPGDEVLDVTGVPEACGLLSEKEVRITNTEVDVLLERLAQGDWSSVDVTTAFYKRAIVAQQVVRLVGHCDIASWPVV